jgi:hypothetical protein
LGADPVVKSLSHDARTGTFTATGRTVAVFMKERGEP